MLPVPAILEHMDTPSRLRSARLPVLILALIVLIIVSLVVVNRAWQPPDSGYLNHELAVAEFNRRIEQAGTDRVTSLQIGRDQFELEVAGNQQQARAAGSYGVQLDAERLGRILVVLAADATACGVDDDPVYRIEGIGFGHGRAYVTACPGAARVRNLDDAELAFWQPLPIDSAAALRAGLKLLSAHDTPNWAVEGVIGGGGAGRLALRYVTPAGGLLVSLSSYGWPYSRSYSTSPADPFRVAALDPDRIWACAQKMAIRTEDGEWSVSLTGNKAGQPVLVWSQKTKTNQDCQPVLR